MEVFINVIKRDPQTQIKIKDILDKYYRLTHIYQSKIRYDTLIWKVILKELIKVLVGSVLDIDIELKMKNSRIKYLESRLS